MDCKWACETKKWLIIIFKEFIKQKQSPNVLFFFCSHWWLHKCFPFPYQGVCKFWKINKISSASFHCTYKWRKFENADRNILQTIIVSNVILAFLDNLKPNIFFVGQTVANNERHPFSKSLNPPLLIKKTLLWEESFN